VGAPPEVLARLTAMTQELEARQRTTLVGLGSATEPELDQFMVSCMSSSTLSIQRKRNAHLDAFSRLIDTQCHSFLVSTRSCLLKCVQEAYHEMLMKFREELTRPLQEAMEFMRTVESQLNSLSISGRSLRNILSSGIENRGS
jgi:hypothetical protein